jgi:hypothetical protein
VTGEVRSGVGDDLIRGAVIGLGGQVDNIGDHGQTVE